MLNARFLLKISSLFLVLSSSMFAVEASIVYGPKVVELPGSEPQCLVRIRKDGRLFTAFFTEFEKKTNNCPSDPSKYYAARDNGAIKVGIAKVGGPMGDSIMVNGVAHKYRTEEMSAVIVLPGKRDGDKVVSWVPYCVPALIPVGGESQTKDKDETVVCKRESPTDEIKSEDIDKELRQQSIKCFGAKKCGETAFTMVPVAAYVAAKTKPHADNSVAGTGNVPNEVSDKNSIVSTDSNKRPTEGSSGTRPNLAPME